MYHMQQKKLLTIWSTCLLKGQVFHEMKSLYWLILLRIYLVWLSYSYCFIFDYNYSSFALRLQTSQHLILDLLYLKQWKASKVRAKRINQNLEIFLVILAPLIDSWVLWMWRLWFQIYEEMIEKSTSRIELQS